MSNDNNAFAELLNWMKQLRDPDTGCAWSKQQTFKSLTKHTIEEAYELADAIESGKIEDIKDELADLLLQFLFYQQIAKENKLFDLTDIVGTLLKKDQQRRVSPQADNQKFNADQVNAIWQAKKLEERPQRQSVLDGITNTLPSLYKAVKLQQRAAETGFDWPNIMGVVNKLQEEVDELIHEIQHNGGEEKLTDELGDVLFSCVNLARHLKIDPDNALRHANNKFKQRFQKIEHIAKVKQEKLTDLSIEQLEAYWQQAKSQ